MDSLKSCRSCYSTKLSDILSMGDQYLSDFVDGDEKPPKYPLDLVLCDNCTLLQLKHTTPASSMYNNHYGYRSGINDTIGTDLKDIVANARKHTSLGIGDTVLDIGSNDATLLKNYPSTIIRVGIDPVGKFAKYYDEDNLTFVNDYFPSDKFTKKAKIITVISCFYDLDTPNEFVEALRNQLDDDGVIVIQQNYVAGMLRQHAYDNVCHEHLEYYSLTSLEHLLNRHYLEVFDVTESSINGGSFRVFVKHMNRVDTMRIREQKLKLHNKFTYLLWGMQVNHLRNELVKFVQKETDKGKTIYLYGASTRVNTILQYCGFDAKFIKAAVERNPEKWGKKIASCGIPIISEEQARKEKPDYMLVGPWFFKNEFLKREEEYLKGGGKFIFPLPEFSVVGYDDIRNHSINP